MEAVVRVLPFGVMELSVTVPASPEASAVRPSQDQDRIVRVLNPTTMQTQIVSVPPPTYSFFAEEAGPSFGQSAR